MNSQRFSRTLRTLQRQRHFSTSSIWHRTPFGGPAPPRLPEEDQKVFEELQKASTGAFSTPRPKIQVNQPATSSSKPRVNQSPNTTDAESSNAAELNARFRAQGEGDELHPNIRRGAPPEFEGDVNPKTGEVGGPKNDPLRWKGDWSYNGRVTDF
jgi:hypothetical protein